MELQNKHTNVMTVFASLKCWATDMFVSLKSLWDCNEWVFCCCFFCVFFYTNLCIIEDRVCIVEDSLQVIEDSVGCVFVSLMCVDLWRICIFEVWIIEWNMMIYMFSQSKCLRHWSCIIDVSRSLKYLHRWNWDHWNKIIYVCASFKYVHQCHLNQLSACIIEVFSSPKCLHSWSVCASLKCFHYSSVCIIQVYFVKFVSVFFIEVRQLKR